MRFMARPVIKVRVKLRIMLRVSVRFRLLFRIIFRAKVRNSSRITARFLCMAGFIIIFFFGYRASGSFRLTFITSVRVSCRMSIWVMVVYVVVKFRVRLKVKDG
jgi:hypothetical protein